MYFFLKKKLIYNEKFFDLCSDKIHGIRCLETGWLHHAIVKRFKDIMLRNVCSSFLFDIETILFCVHEEKETKLTGQYILYFLR